ncbi:MAG TPA: hypothetical protein VMP01_03125 [Pirellulaceae bacterium]|nr:hypothetical protein [Pirellulaceae bacterium]
MSDNLTRMLRLTDYTTVVECKFDDVAEWPVGELNRCLSAGLLSPAEPAQSVVCEECGEIEDVVLMESVVSPPFVPYVRCGLVGAYRITKERLQRWRMSVHQLIDSAFRGIDFVGGRHELTRMRMWRLGKSRWAGTHWNVHFGRALQCRDAWQIINRASLPARSVLFVPSKAPEADDRITRMPVVIGLDTVLSWNGDHLRINHAQIEQQLACELAASKLLSGDKPFPKRGSRAALIESLRRELEEHLRAARDYAEETLDRTGTPQLLPRPTMELLAKRLGVNRSTVSRCFEDKSGGQIRMLWEVAADLDRLLSAASGCGN